MYRRTCFEEIGGLVPALGWDGIDQWQALTLGWELQSFSELKVLHHRAAGKATGSLKGKIEQGYGVHYMGYHPLYNRSGNMACSHPAALSRWGNSDDHSLLRSLVTRSRAVGGPLCNFLYSTYSVEAVGSLVGGETSA
jgi:hypothetical protein